MTKEEILAMNPSVQLGNLVATEVMKWHREGDHWVAPEGFWIKAEGLDGWYPWRDISAAWQVVEKMLREGYGLLMMGDVDKFTVILSADMNYKAEAKTAPEAICKAALLTKLALHSERK